MDIKAFATRLENILKTQQTPEGRFAKYQFDFATTDNMETNNSASIHLKMTETETNKVASDITIAVAENKGRNPKKEKVTAAAFMIDNVTHAVFWAKISENPMNNIEKYILSRLISRSAKRGTKIDGLYEIVDKIIVDFDTNFD